MPASIFIRDYMTHAREAQQSRYQRAQAQQQSQSKPQLTKRNLNWNQDFHASRSLDLARRMSSDSGVSNNSSSSSSSSSSSTRA
ncbi:unnamed protein product [Sympodiomycopsis kandeliae]